MYSKTTIVLQIALFSLLLIGCGTTKHPFLSKDALDWESAMLPHESKKVHTLYLVGDAGELDNEADSSNFVIMGMTSMIDMNDQNASVAFLGDNIYPVGLVDKIDTKRRAEGQKIVHAQLYPLKNFLGQTYIIPGNHDWNKAKEGGLKAVQRQEFYMESNYGNNSRLYFYPNNGCGDPEVVEINNEVVFLFMDSQWWLQNWDKEENINQGCTLQSRNDFLQHMEDLFLKYKDKEIICMLHHPIKSNGNHGGYFSWTQHIFPLAELGVWIPLPIIGSIYPLYRKTKGVKQDNTNTQNQNLTKGLETLAKKLDLNVVFVSGHEHGLEYFASEKIKYIVSGSGSKTSYIQKGGEAKYAREKRGFARINFYQDFESWLEIYTVEGYGTVPLLEYRVKLRAAGESMMNGN